MLNDIASNVKVASAMTSGAITASFNGTGIDGDKSVSKGIQVLLGAVTANDASNYFAFTIEDSADNTTFAAWAPSKSKSTVGLVAGDRIALQYDGIQRYFRLVGTETGAASIVLSANALLLPTLLPVVQK